MTTALDDVAFLALSENRIAFLDALSDEQTHNRDELLEATDVSRPTLARILDDLDSRAWITQHGQDCRITELGAWVHEAFTDLLEMMATANQVRDFVRWLPADAIDRGLIRRFDLRGPWHQRRDLRGVLPSVHPWAAPERRSRPSLGRR